MTNLPVAASSQGERVREGLMIAAAGIDEFSAGLGGGRPGLERGHAAGGSARGDE